MEPVLGAGHPNPPHPAGDPPSPPTGVAGSASARSRSASTPSGFDDAPSFWFDAVRATPAAGDAGWEPGASAAGTHRPEAVGNLEADVCIVGAGYTGLWTAWALLRAQPDLRVVVVEAAYAGFGASGRNGGWLSGLLPGSRPRLASGPGGPAGVMALQRALIDAVTEVGEIIRLEGIDCDYHHGGTLAVAVNQAQRYRLQQGLAEDRAWGLDETDVCALDAGQTAERIQVDRAVAALFSPHCARIQPAKLVVGLAAAVERRGGLIYEGSPALAVAAGRVDCPRATVRAPWVVLATEGYTASLPGRERRLLPMNSHMIVTPPLPASAWDAIGWQGAETVMDGGNAYTYLQRTADARIALGGRGVPYRFGSRAARAAVDRRRYDPPDETVRSLEAAVQRLFPHVPPELLKAERAWSGVLGVARDWCPSIVIEPSGPRRATRSKGVRAPEGGTESTAPEGGTGPAAGGVAGGAAAGGVAGRGVALGELAGRGVGGGGLAWAGGYVGDGVSTSYLAGMTLADLILGRDSQRVRLPWVGRRSRDWEPEPLRWLGVKSVYALYRAADRSESRHPERMRPSALGRLADAVAGRH
ncbi:MAG: FAD-dependent oxidoreductase [Acidobacteriota bacterium]|nr:FAD-dependent oxidoreductase [Acidobacteriota bacterium]